MAAPATDRPRVRVAALICTEGRVVCVRHRAGSSVYHLLPGGGVGYRETIEDALVREVQEETGFEVAVGRPLLISDTIDPEGSRHVVNLTFEATITGGAITTRPADPRVAAVDLIHPDQLGALDLRPPIASAILDVLASPDAFQTRYLGSLFTTGATSGAQPGPGSETPSEQGSQDNRPAEDVS